VPGIAAAVRQSLGLSSVLPLGLMLLFAAPTGPTALTAPTAPTVLTVSTIRGDTRIPVRLDPKAGPMIPAPALITALGGSHRNDGIWADVTVARQPFRFLLESPWVALGTTRRPIAAPARILRDTLFLPLQFVAEVLPRTLSAVYRYDPAAGRLTEVPGRAIAAGNTPPDVTPVDRPAPVVPPPARTPDLLPNGLRRGHVIAIDPGHGGVDPGNRGVGLPAGISEKDINLQVGLLLRDELQRRGIGVRMTRTTDTLINLFQRAPRSCRDDCVLFVSIHVNSLARRPGYTSARGFETFVFSEARTEDARRVAQMENDAMRFEVASGSEQPRGLDFILRDLQLNEHLRESVRAAELMQSNLQEVHSGPNRGVKHSPLAVLNTARRPAVLVELGFATNTTDARLMTSRQGQRNLSLALADAVISYLREYERRVGAPTPDEGPR
jgi:N-acetylmuramoyl-L-alanine amidase